jgi:hypothetical protein
VFVYFARLWSYGVCMLILLVACIVHACKLSLFQIEERPCVMRHKIPQVKPNMEKCLRMWIFLPLFFMVLVYFLKTFEVL